MSECEAAFGGWAQLTGSVFIAVFAAALFIPSLKAGNWVGIVATPVGLLIAIPIFWAIC